MRVKEFDTKCRLFVWVLIHIRIPIDDIGKVSQLHEGDLMMTFAYGPDGERWYSHLTRSGKTERESVYAGTYERITQGGVTREFWYLDNGVVVIRQDGGEFKPYAMFADEQGSVLTVADKEGNRVFEASYDAWGRQTVATNTIGFTRGYTGHEMLPEFGIINMGGRLYDPVLGRFFSPDNYVQQPTNSQNFNRYSYCLNNPLKYTDPTGQMISPLLAMAIFNVGSNLLQVATGQSSWKTALINIASAAATYGIGQAFGAVGGIGRELLRAGAHGLSSGVFSIIGGGNFGSGFVSGVFASGVGSMTDGMSAVPSGIKLLTSAFAGGVGSALAGGDFIAGAVNGIRIWSLNDALHGAASDPELEDILRQRPRPVNGMFVDSEGYHWLTGATCFGGTGNMTFNDGIILINNTLDIPSKTNTIPNSIATALIDYAGNSTYGSNRRFYFHKKAERSFYGNQYVKTIKLSTIGRNMYKYTGPLGYAIGGFQVGIGLYEDSKILQDTGHTNWYNSTKAAGEFTGGLAMGAVCAKIGGVFGGLLGGVPGAIIGAAIGGCVGAYYGSQASGDLVDSFYGL